MTEILSEVKIPYCCNKAKSVIPDSSLLFRLYVMKQQIGSDFLKKITSGVRCPECNKKVGGVESSAHLLGKAVDVAVSDSRERMEIVRVAMQVGFTRIGIGKNFVHLDVDNTKTDYVLWLY